MNRLFVLVCTAWLWLFAAVPQAHALVLAVGTFEPAGGGEAYAPLRKALADMFITDLYGTEGLQVVERDRLQNVLAELKLGKQGFLDPKTVQKLGQGVGATHLLHGSFAVAGGQLRMDARLVDVATGKVQLAAQQSGPQDDVFAIQRALAEQLRKSLALASSAAPAKAGKVSLEDATTLGRALDAVDAGKLEEARKLLEALAAQRPDFAAVQRGLEALSRRIARLMQEAQFIPEQLLAALSQIDGGDPSACQDFNLGLSEWLNPLAIGLGQQLGGQLPADDPDAVKRLAGAYALVLAGLQKTKLTDTSCPGGNPVGHLLGYFLVAPMQMLAKQVRECDALGLALNRRMSAAQYRQQCERALDRVPELRAPDGQIVVAKADYVRLYVQLGQVLVERFPKHMLTRTILPQLQGFVEHVRISSLTGKAREQAVAEALVAQARAALQQYSALGAMQVALVQWPTPEAGAPPPAHWHDTTARLNLFSNGVSSEVLGGTGQIELTVDGKTWLPWPRRTELPGQERGGGGLMWRAGLPAIGVFGVAPSGSSELPDWTWYEQAVLRGAVVNPALLGLRLQALTGAPLATCTLQQTDSQKTGPVQTGMWHCKQVKK
jgi:TolB-like protein